VLMKRIEKVTASDVRRVAKDIFRPERMNLTVIGPHPDSAEYKKLLSPRKR
jgi:predicted Zn-dependent peptidase